MGWLKIQKRDYLENGKYLFYEIKNILTSVKVKFLKSYGFVTEVAFKKFIATFLRILSVKNRPSLC